MKYTNLERLLLDLGFHHGQTTGTHLLFENPNFDAVIVLPLYQAEDAVLPHHWQNIRWTLEEKGILGKEASDKLTNAANDFPA